MLRTFWNKLHFIPRQASEVLWASVTAVVGLAGTYFTLPHGPFWGVFSGVVLYVIFVCWRIGRVGTEWESYRNVLKELTSQKEEGKYYYEKLSFIYTIGKRPRQDKLARVYELKANRNLIKVKDLRFGASGNNVPPLPFSALHVKVWQNKSSNKKDKKRPKRHSLLIIPRAGEMISRDWEAAIYINPGLAKGETLSFTVTGGWRGVWNDLRESGNDNCTVRLKRFAKQFELVITEPPDMPIEEDPDKKREHPKEARCNFDPDGRDKSGRHQLIWKFENAIDGEYRVFIRKKRESNTLEEA